MFRFNTGTAVSEDFKSGMILGSIAALLWQQQIPVTLGDNGKEYIKALFLSYEYSSKGDCCITVQKNNIVIEAEDLDEDYFLDLDDCHLIKKIIEIIK